MPLASLAFLTLLAAPKNGPILLLTNRGVRDGEWMRDARKDGYHLYTLKEPKSKWPPTLGLNPQKDFTAQNGTLNHYAGQLLNLGKANGGNLIFYVHGFNSSVRDAVGTISKIREEMQDRGVRGTFVAISWPSDKRPERYNQDLGDSRSSGEAFAPFLVALEDQIKSYKGVKTTLITHSMGGQFITRACRARNNGQMVVNPPLDEIVLTAPDLDRSDLNVDKFGVDCVQVAKHLTCYFSDQDFALGGSGLFRGTTGGRLGSQGPQDYDNLPDGILIVNGSRDIKPGRNPIGLGVSHFAYFDNDTFLDDLACLIAGGEFKKGSREKVNEWLVRLRRVKTP